MFKPEHIKSLAKEQGQVSLESYGRLSLQKDGLIELVEHCTSELPKGYKRKKKFCLWEIILETKTGREIAFEIEEVLSRKRQHEPYEDYDKSVVELGYGPSKSGDGLDLGMKSTPKLHAGDEVHIPAYVLPVPKGKGGIEAICYQDAMVPNVAGDLREYYCMQKAKQVALKPWLQVKKFVNLLGDERYLAQVAARATKAERDKLTRERHTLVCKFWDTYFHTGYIGNFYGIKDRKEYHESMDRCGRLYKSFTRPSKFNTALAKEGEPETLCMQLALGADTFINNFGDNAGHEIFRYVYSDSGNVKEVILTEMSIKGGIRDKAKMFNDMEAAAYKNGREKAKRGKKVVRSVASHCMVETREVVYSKVLTEEVRWEVPSKDGKLHNPGYIKDFTTMRGLLWESVHEDVFKDGSGKELWGELEKDLTAQAKEEWTTFVVNPGLHHPQAGFIFFLNKIRSLGEQLKAQRAVVNSEEEKALNSLLWEDFNELKLKQTYYQHVANYTWGELDHDVINKLNAEMAQLEPLIKGERWATENNPPLDPVGDEEQQILKTMDFLTVLADESEFSHVDGAYYATYNRGRCGIGCKCPRCVPQHGLSTNESREAKLNMHHYFSTQEGESEFHKLSRMESMQGGDYPVFMDSNILSQAFAAWNLIENPQAVEEQGEIDPEMGAVTEEDIQAVDDYFINQQGFESIEEVPVEHLMAYEI